MRTRNVEHPWSPGSSRRWPRSLRAAVSTLGVAFGSALGAAATGCSAGEYDLQVRFDSVGTLRETATLDVFVLRRCDPAARRDGTTPDAPVLAQLALTPGAAILVGRVPSGRAGIYVRARAIDCQVIAVGCEDFDLSSRGGHLVVPVVTTSGVRCEPGLACMDGACRNGPMATDAGLDADTQTPPDAPADQDHADVLDATDMDASEVVVHPADAADAHSDASDVSDVSDATADAADSGCPPSAHRCGTSCVSNLDPSTCGQLCTPCPNAPHAAGRCAAESCVLVCNSGWRDCDGVPSTGCETAIDTTSDCGGCGNVCASGRYCERLSTTWACSAGPCMGTVCSGECVDLLTDPTHCGICTRFCGASTTCVNGMCI